MADLTVRQVIDKVTSGQIRIPVFQRGSRGSLGALPGRQSQE